MINTLIGLCLVLSILSLTIAISMYYYLNEIIKHFNSMVEIVDLLMIDEDDEELTDDKSD